MNDEKNLQGKYFQVNKRTQFSSLTIDWNVGKAVGAGNLFAIYQVPLLFP
jgi:hypothetical protein